MSKSNVYDYARADRERAMSKADKILMARSLLASADSVRSLSLSESYRKGARSFMARNGITDEDLKEAP